MATVLYIIHRLMNNHFLFWELLLFTGGYNVLKPDSMLPACAHYYSTVKSN